MISKLLFTFYLALLTLFGLLSYFIHESYDLPGDRVIISWFTTINLPPLYSMMQVVSTLGETIPAVILVLLVVIILLFFKKRLEALFIIVITSLTALLTWLTKELVDRPRPGDVFLGNDELSFPSGHVTHIFVLFGFLLYLLPRLINHAILLTTLQAMIVILLLLMMLSRLYLGEHWPSDVLGSIILGGLVLIPLIVLCDKLTFRRKNARTT